MLFGLIKKEMKAPEIFYDFPVSDQKILSGPKMINTKDYTRAIYYTKDVESYKMKVEAAGFSKKSDVKYERFDKKNYIIIEKEGNKFKIAFHKKK